ncbi:DUF7547 family protein [Halovivax limisalsi]|uniref:DUF7547 family protein n=1 Tax=Halovivax limisalsi TaxID=1453760 RepID=UPI001FFC53A0|nr:hypothetical protein [Halovivax limisalsi]
MDDELASAIDDLADAVATLGEALDARSGPRLRPPRPAEVLRATDEVAIPTLIAALEAQIRMLELARRGTRLVRYDRAIRDPPPRGDSTRRSDGPDRPERLLSQLGRTIDRIRSQVDAAEDDRVEDALSRTQSVYDDLERALLGASQSDRDRSADRRATTDSSRSTQGFEIEIDDGSGSTDDATRGSTDDPSRTDDAGSVEVDVDAELETLRDRYGNEDESAHAADSDGSTRAADDSGPAPDPDGSSSASAGTPATSDDAVADDPTETDRRSGDPPSAESNEADADEPDDADTDSTGESSDGAE